MLLGAGKIAVNKTGKVPALMELRFLGGGKLLINKNKYMNEVTAKCEDYKTGI